MLLNIHLKHKTIRKNAGKISYTFFVGVEWAGQLEHLWPSLYGVFKSRATVVCLMSLVSVWM
jgi:hypothetical protein